MHLTAMIQPKLNFRVPSISTGKLMLVFNSPHTENQRNIKVLNLSWIASNFLNNRNKERSWILLWVRCTYERKPREIMKSCYSVIRLYVKALCVMVIWYFTYTFTIYEPPQPGDWHEPNIQSEAPWASKLITQCKLIAFCMERHLISIEEVNRINMRRHLMTNVLGLRLPESE